MPPGDNSGPWLQRPPAARGRAIQGEQGTMDPTGVARYNNHQFFDMSNMIRGLVTLTALIPKLASGCGAAMLSV
jgi:hypothetical protein